MDVKHDLLFCSGHTEKGFPCNRAHLEYIVENISFCFMLVFYQYLVKWSSQTKFSVYSGVKCRSELLTLLYFFSRFFHSNEIFSYLVFNYM